MGIENGEILKKLEEGGFNEQDPGTFGGLKKSEEINAAIVGGNRDDSVAQRVDRMKKHLTPEELANYEKEISKSDLERAIKGNKTVLLPKEMMEEYGGIEIGTAWLQYQRSYNKNIPLTVFIRYIDSDGNFAETALDVAKIRDFSHIQKIAGSYVEGSQEAQNIEFQISRPLQELGFQISPNSEENIKFLQKLLDKSFEYRRKQNENEKKGERFRF